MAYTPGPATYRQYGFSSRFYFPQPRPISVFWNYVGWILWRSLILGFAILCMFIVLSMRMHDIEEKRENRERMAIEAGLLRGLTETQIAKIFPPVSDVTYPGDEPMISDWDAYYYLSREQEYYIAVLFDEAGRATTFRVEEIYYADPYMD